MDQPQAPDVLELGQIDGPVEKQMDNGCFTLSIL